MLKNKINNIKVFGFHGVYEDEIENGQFFIINIEYIPNYKTIDNKLNWSKIYTDKDDIDSIIDYVDIIKELEQHFNDRRFNLLESLACYLLDSINQVFCFKYAKISIKKEFSNSKNKINANSVEVDWELEFE